MGETLSLSSFTKKEISYSKEDPIKFVYERESRFWDIKPVRRYTDFLEINGFLNDKPEILKRNARLRDLTDLLKEEIEKSILRNQAIVGSLLAPPGEGKSTLAKVLGSYIKLFWDENKNRICRAFVTWNPAETRKVFRKLQNGDVVIQDELNKQSGKGSRSIYQDIGNLIATTRKAQNSFLVCDPREEGINIILSFILEVFGINWESDPPLIRAYLIESKEERYIGMVYLPVLILDEIEENYEDSKDRYIELLKATGGAETAFIDEERAQEDIEYLLSMLVGNESRQLIEAEAQDIVIGDLNYFNYVINRVWKTILRKREEIKRLTQKQKFHEKQDLLKQQRELLDEILVNITEDIDILHSKLKNSAIRAYLRNKGIIDDLHSEALQRIELMKFYHYKEIEKTKIENFTIEPNDSWNETMSKFIKFRTLSWTDKKNKKIDLEKARRMGLLYPYYVRNSKKNEAYNKIGKAEYIASIRTSYNDWDSLVDFLTDSKVSSEIGALVFEPFFKNLLQQHFRILEEGQAGFEPGIDCLVQSEKTGKIYVLTLKCYHRNQNNLEEGSFSEAEAERAKKERVPVYGVLWNPFWGEYLCKSLDPDKKERIKWSIKEIGSPEDKKIKKLLQI